MCQVVINDLKSNISGESKLELLTIYYLKFVGNYYENIVDV